MAKVKGIGGIFFKSANPDALKTWYAAHLGLPVTGDGYVQFHWQEADDAHATQSTIWSLFEAKTTYFEPSKASFMINYIVDDLDATLSELRAAGVPVDDKVEEYEFGRFGWAMDPDGNRFELWEPPKPSS